MEHLVREIRDLSLNSLKTKLAGKLNSMVLLSNKVEVLENYLEGILAGKTKPDQKILMLIQRILGGLGHTQEETVTQEVSRIVNNNYLHIYMASVVTTVIKCHDFIDN